jgi:hypothetical protein
MAVSDSASGTNKPPKTLTAQLVNVRDRQTRNVNGTLILETNDLLPNGGANFGLWRYIAAESTSGLFSKRSNSKTMRDRPETTMEHRHKADI